MPQSSLSRITGSLIAKISSSDIQQASLHIGIHHDLQEFQASLLSIIEDGLLESDKMQGKNPKFKDWLSKLKDVLCDAENVLDEFQCKRLRNQMVSARGSDLTKVFFTTSYPLLFGLRMSKKIKQLKERLSDCLDTPQSSLSRIAKSLISKISSSDIQQTSRDIGIYHDLLSFQASLLSRIEDGLLEAAKMQGKNPEFKDWLSKLKDVLSDAENMLDEFQCKRLRNQMVSACGSDLTKVFFTTSYPLLFGLRMSEKIKQLKERLSDCLDTPLLDVHPVRFNTLLVTNQLIPMAESSLSRIADSLIAKISSSYIQQTSRESGVYHDLQAFKKSLLSIIEDGLLEDDMMQGQNPELYGWLSMLKHILSDAENVVDEFECERLRNEVVNDHGSAITKVACFFSTPNPLAFGLKIARLKKRLHDCEDQMMYVVNTRIVDQNRMMGRFKSSVYSFPCEIIGREDDKEIIIKLLMQLNPCADHHHQSLSVIPIVGMAGLGKTTLARSIFNDKRIDQSFSSKIWVFVSDDFNIQQVIAQIIQSVTGTLPEMGEPINQIRNILAKRKFLLVLDNVWNEDPLKWAELRNLMSMGMEGSKILVTTRSHSIASMMGTIPSHTLKALSMEDSLFLFEKHAFEEEEKKFPDLIKVGREIANRCGGVPLAIKSMGSMLCSKYAIKEWELMRDREFWDFPGDQILSTLRLSYHHMPSHLKQCFELFSLYPKDFVFDSSEVASLWASLGLLPSPNKDETLIDVANQCLQELMSRSFLQEFVNFGTSYYFQINDFVNDLARSIAKDECLMINSNIQDIPQNVQHLSFAENDLLGKSFTPKSVVVRTILFPIEGVGASNEDFLNMCVSRYRYLRILDLSDSTYETLPWSTGKLRHLRFLSLERNKKIKRVPDSICNLQNLQVLNLAGCTELEILPKGLRKLISLQRLGITTKESALPENDIANLNSLEILNIESCGNLESIFVRVKLATLRTLAVANCGSLKSVPLDINHFPQLETLLVDNCGYLELTKGYDDLNSNLRLKAIRLHSLPQLLTLPSWLQESTNTLQSLLIVDCKNLEVFPEWLSTLSFLGSFGMINCPKLMFLPNDIHHLTALGYLRIEGCPELCRKCQPQVGEYWPKISHIKQIFIGELEDLKEESVEEEE